MFSASDLIEVLCRRRRRSIRPDMPEGFPPGWTQWFASMRAAPDAVTGASAGAIVSLLAARPPPPRRKGQVPAHALAAWLSLLHPLGVPDAPDQRGSRRFSLAVALLAQVFWVGGLLLLTHTRFAVPAPAALGETQVVQAVFIGDGTPEDAGGGASEGVPASTSQVAPVEPVPVAPARPAPSPSAVEDASAAPVAAVDAIPAEPPPQTLQITEVTAPDIDFTLPPPQAGAVPDVVLRERSVPEAQLQAVEVPALRTPAPLAAVPTTQREIDIEIRERSVPQPSEALRLPTREAPQVVVESPEMPARQAPDLVLRERAVPMRDASPLTGPAVEPAPATPAAPLATVPEARPAGTPAPAVGEGARAMAPGSGTSTRAGRPPGAAPSSRAGDAWGDRATSRDGGDPGSPSGLFGADGRPRLAGDGRVGGGLPPGTVTEDFARIDREGTWLKRPPTDYEPTSFDRFWSPSETLLQEWVRRSVKTVLIPIPGTSKTVQCNVALLMFGGACGITDPNMQDVETDGRPPPDVPWKPELQEDQDSLRR